MGIQFEENELSGGQFLGEGIHECVITKVTPGVSKHKGTPQVEVEFTSRSGKTTRDFMVIQGNKFRLAALAQAVGFTKEQLLAGRFDVPMLGGKSVRVVREVKGKNEEGKNVYENSYLPSEAKTAVTPDEIPF